MNKKPSVSVIIPAINEVANISQAVERAWAAGASEVIVADGGSTDGTLEKLQEADCIVVNSPAGRGTQQNAGANAATGDLLLFLHADNYLETGALNQLADCDSSRPLAGCFRQRISANGFRFRVLEWGNELRATWLGRPYGDQGIFVDRRLFHEVGGFPEIPLMEELPFMKAITSNTKLTLLPGPLHISARRWQRYGVIRQTLRNWSLLVRYYFGAAPEELAKSYRRHDR